MQWLGTMPTTNQKMIFGVPLGQELPLTAAADCSLFAMVRVPRYVATEYFELSGVANWQDTLCLASAFTASLL